MIDSDPVEHLLRIVNAHCFSRSSGDEAACLRRGAFVVSHPAEHSRVAEFIEQRERRDRGEGDFAQQFSGQSRSLSGGEITVNSPGESDLIFPAEPLAEQFIPGAVEEAASDVLANEGEFRAEQRDLP